MMAIAAGYEAVDDLDALRHDPALLIACNRAPEGGHDIPSQPTISRFENLADFKTLYRIGIGFVDLYCRGYRDRSALSAGRFRRETNRTRASPRLATPRCAVVHHGSCLLHRLGVGTDCAVGPPPWPNPQPLTTA